MKTQPKYKVCRRLGPGVYEKCQTESYSVSESKKKAARGRGRRRNVSGYGEQLLKKQYVRTMYGMTEKQFSTYVHQAEKAENPTQTLYTLLESRLDNVVYRLSLAPTRRAARQMVSHGHILVNGKKIKVPSHQVQPTDTVAIREGSKNTKLFENLAEILKERNTIPGWLDFDVKEGKGTMKNVASLEESNANLNLVPVIEFYSR